MLVLSAAAGTIIVHAQSQYHVVVILSTVAGIFNIPYGAYHSGKLTGDVLSRPSV